MESARIDETHRKELLGFLLVKTAAVRRGVKPAELLRVRHCYSGVNSEGLRVCLYRSDIYGILRLAYIELRPLLCAPRRFFWWRRRPGVMVVDAAVVASDAMGAGSVAILMFASGLVGLATREQKPGGEQRNQQYSKHDVLLSANLCHHYTILLSIGQTRVLAGRVFTALFSLPPLNSTPRACKGAPRRRLRALRVRLRRIFPPLRFGAFPLRLMLRTAEPQVILRSYIS